jgi:hypothetical protein
VGSQGLQGGLQLGLAVGNLAPPLLDGGRLGLVDHGQRGDLHILELPHQLDGLDGIGHHARRDVAHLAGAELGTVDGKAADGGQRQEDGQHQQGNPASDGHGLLPEEELLGSGAPCLEPRPERRGSVRATRRSVAAAAGEPSVDDAAFSACFHNRHFIKTS